jgi:hypothetical protein
VQQPTPRAADLEIRHLANFVVTEVVRARGLLAQQAPPHERLERVEQLVFGRLHDGEQAFEIEPPAEHRRDVEHRARLRGHVLQPRAHGRTQRLGQRQPAGRVRGDLAFPQRVQHRRQKERVAVRFALQAACEVRAAVAAEQFARLGEREPRKRDVPRVRLAAQARDEICQPRATVELLVPVRVQREYGQAPGLATEVVEELRTRVVGPLQIVDDDEQVAGRRRELQQLHDRTEEPRLARFWQIRREHRHRGAVRDLGHECCDLGERHGRQLLQRALRGQRKRLRDDVDRGLIRHRGFDFVAVGGERRGPTRPRLPRQLAHEPALADAGLALDERHVAAAGAYAGEQPHEHVALLAPSDETPGFSLLRRLGRERRFVDDEVLGRAQGAGHLEKRIALVRRNREPVGEPLGEPPRRATLVGLDLADREVRARDSLRELLLRQVERLAPPLQPVAERCRPIIHGVALPPAEPRETGAYSRDPFSQGLLCPDSGGFLSRCLSRSA